MKKYLSNELCDIINYIKSRTEESYIGTIVDANIFKEKFLANQNITNYEKVSMFETWVNFEDHGIRIDAFVKEDIEIFIRFKLKNNLKLVPCQMMMTVVNNMKNTMCAKM